MNIPFSPPPYDRLALFAESLGTCLRSGVSLERSLGVSARSLSGTRYDAAAEGAMEAIRGGSSLADSLDLPGVRWPPFFLSVLRAGEQAGRVDEALAYLAQHCRLLAAPTQAIFRLWLYPLALLVAGIGLQVAAELGLGTFVGAIAALGRGALQLAVLCGIAYWLVTPRSRRVVDRLRMRLPFLSQADRELAVNRFFHILSLLYSTGGKRVEAMIELAGESAPNLAVRADLLRSAEEIRAGRPLAEAFRDCEYLRPEEKALLAVGDITGTFEQTCQRIATSAGELLQDRCEQFQKISLRLSMSGLMIAIALTLARLLGP